MGQCVIKDCGFNVQKLNEPERQNLNNFLKERIKERYSTLEKQKQTISQKTHSSLATDQIYKKNAKNTSNSITSNEEENGDDGHSNFQMENEPQPQVNTNKSSGPSSPSRNLKKFKDLTLNETFLQNKHFFTPKSSEEEAFKNIPKINHAKNPSIDFQKKIEPSPKSTAMKTTETNNEKKFQNGFQNNFFNPIQMHIESPENRTPTKMEFGNIFTEEELSDVSGDMENFEKKFPQEIIEKYSKKSKTKIN